jgi:hypothetical protein
MPARWRNQGRQSLDQFEWGQHQADAAARSRLDALIDQVLGIDFTQPFQREGWPRATAQQALQAQVIVRFDAHAGIHRETPTVIPGAHRRGVFAFEHSATGENAQQTVSHLGLNLGDGFGTDAPGFMKAHAACAIGLENPLDHDAVEMDVGIEQGAQAMDEGDGTDPGGWVRPPGCTGANPAPPQRGIGATPGFARPGHFAGSGVAASAPTAPIDNTHRWRTGRRGMT